MKFICLGSAAAAVPSTCVLWEFLGELMQMAHSQNHQILANYWDLAYAALDGPNQKHQILAYYWDSAWSLPM